LVSTNPEEAINVTEELLANPSALAVFEAAFEMMAYR